MKEKGVILSYKVDKTLDSLQRNKTTEAKITITPHPQFVGEVMQANKHQTAVKQFPVET
jgi:hypothetical protein